MWNSKIGNIYTYRFEKTMLQVANALEQEGYKVKRYYDKSFNNFKIEIVGYRK